MSQEILNSMLDNCHINYIVVETKYTKHHIEKLMLTNKDRGCFKWIAETKFHDYSNITDEEDIKEAERSHIDSEDCFPRYMFLANSMFNELFAWLKARNLKIIDIKSPKI